MAHSYFHATTAVCRRIGQSQVPLIVVVVVVGHEVTMEFVINMTTTTGVHLLARFYSTSHTNALQ